MGGVRRQPDVHAAARRVAVRRGHPPAGAGVDPFLSEEAHELLLDGAADLFGVPRPRVLERWQGVYASGPEEFLLARPVPGVVVATVTTGIGMTTGLGLAEHAVQSALQGEGP